IHMNMLQHYTFTLSLHDALPILRWEVSAADQHRPRPGGRGAGLQGSLAGRARLPHPQVRPGLAADVPLDGAAGPGARDGVLPRPDRKSTRLNSSHVKTSYALFCL